MKNDINKKNKKNKKKENIYVYREKNAVLN